MSAPEIAAAPGPLPAASPATPEPAHAELAEDQVTTTAALTPPPSSQQHRNKFTSPAHDAPLQPLSLTASARDDLLRDDVSLETVQDRISSMPAEGLRDVVTRFVLKLHDAQSMAAHYKLQHQMSQMESGEAVERMAVEMEMAKREIEVMQTTETNIKLHEKTKDAASLEQANFRQVHHDIYDAMCDEIRDLKTHNAVLEQDLVHTRRILSQQESEIASLNDMMSLMRDRIRESRDQLSKYRKQGTIDSTPRTNRDVTPLRTPVRDRLAPWETPSRHPQSEGPRRHPQSHGRQQYEPDQHHQRQQQQPGFAALLQATDMISQGAYSPTRQHHRPHSQPAESTPSLPSTPSRPPRTIFHGLYTPQPAKRIPMDVPSTAPMPRKRARDTLTPPPQMRDYDSDGTVSAPDADSEAETEVAPGTKDVGSSLMERERSRGPIIKRAKSAFNIRGKADAQSRIFAPVVKNNVARPDGSKEWEERRRQDDARLGIQRSQRV